MRTLRELVSEYEDGDAVAIGQPKAGEQVYTYERLESTTWATANVLSEEGVDENSRVAIAPAEASETVVALLASAALGATVWFGGPARANVDAVLGPTDVVSEYEVPSHAVRIGFGTTPDGDEILHFGRAVWKADETPPDAPVLTKTPAITNVETTYTHKQLLAAGKKVIDARDVAADTIVVVRAPLTDPRTVAAGIVAPLVAGGTIRFPVDKTPHGDISITDSEAPENRLMLLFDVPLEGE